MADPIISQEVDIEMLEKLADGTFKIKYPKTKADLVIGLTKRHVGLENVENYGVATQAEAEAGIVNNKYMTPLRVKQAINSLVPISKLVTGSIAADVDNYTYLDLGFLPKILYITPTNSTNSNCFYYNGRVFWPSGFTRWIDDVTGTTFRIAKGSVVLHYWAIG